MTIDNKQLSIDIKNYAKSLGFSAVGISKPELNNTEQHYFNWLNAGYHGSMEYMIKHKDIRTNPKKLLPNTLSLISVRFSYFDTSSSNPIEQLHKSNAAYISRYALGRDYHKIIRKKLQKLALFIKKFIPELEYRAFCDSAPILETSIAQQSGLGFIGKNSLLIHPEAGSWFFLGELFISHSLPIDKNVHKSGCGSCNACKVECPTQAIVSDGVIDARRCISYLTIEHKGVIKEELRHLIGNRIYGCDDCQLVCPWNHFLDPCEENLFSARHNLDNAKLLTLWLWTEQEFMDKFKGSPIRRIGYQQWSRNIAIALGNIQTTDLTNIDSIITALKNKLNNTSELVKIHINWSVEKQYKQKNTHKLTKNKGTLDNNSVKINKNHTPFYAKRYYIPKKIKMRPLHNSSGV